MNAIVLIRCVIKQFIDVVLHLVLFLIKNSKMCVNVVSEDPFLILYCSDKYKTQKVCEKADNDILAALKLILHWFVTSKMSK